MHTALWHITITLRMLLHVHLANVSCHVSKCVGCRRVHLPVAYHGRSSSIVVSGTSIHRPWWVCEPDCCLLLNVSGCRRVWLSLEHALALQQVSVHKSTDSLSASESFVACRGQQRSADGKIECQPSSRMDFELEMVSFSLVLVQLAMLQMVII